MYNKKQQEIGF